MKLSLFTPTHRPQHLIELRNSLLQQEGEVDWEWIIVPNGNCKPDDIPAVVRNDEHVKITPTELKGIGALKRFACSLCTGDVYVEMDHDDTLIPTAFWALAEAYSKSPNGFYYSDFINLRADGSCETYSSRYGWAVYYTIIDGKKYKASRAFEPTARSLCQIFFAPNHVRAWSAKAYELSGGHDETLKVGDDHDLVCRTFIAGTPFVWIQEPLYIYRRSGKQSFVEFNKEIQIQQHVNCNKYLHALIHAECLLRKLPDLDIGRAEHCPPGQENYDLVAHGFDKPLPYDDGTVGCISATDCLQRVPRTSVVWLMNEVYRVLRPGGWLLTSTPSIDDGQGKVGRGAFQDPSHCSGWAQNNFWYFTQKQYATLLPGYKGKFQSVRLWTGYPSNWHRDHAIPYVSADLCALKGQRQPGECHI